MTLQFVLGKDGYDHQSKMVEILKQQKLTQQGDKFFYLVPNHIKFESEVEILKQLADPDESVTAQSDIQILSFTRLAWFFLRKTPTYQKQRISNAGISMLLYQIIVDNQSQLTLFAQEIHHPGFIDQLARQIAEMQAGNVMPETLLEMLENSQSQLSNDLRDKLHDFSIIYTAYVNRIDDKYFDNHNVLNLLSDTLINDDLSHYHFYISDFSKLTAQECTLVETLIKKAGSVTVSLILDQAYPVELPKEPNLFYQPAKLFQRLYQFAAQNKIPYLPVVTADQPRVAPDLLKLEKYWEQSSSLGKIDADNRIDNKSIQVYQADNGYSELNQVATMIHQLVATGNYRYSDFLILTRRLDNYETILDPIFQTQQIPYFKDIQKSMVDHPLVELLAALFDIYDPDNSRNYRYDDVMRFLKSELVLPVSHHRPMKLSAYRQAVALTENLILKNGYEGSRWTQKEDWQYVWVPDEDQKPIITDKDREITRQINVIRHLIKETLPKFYRRFYKSKTNREAAGLLYRFLTDAGVVDRLQEWRNAAIDAGDINRSNEVEQVWRTFCSLLDECVNILGDQPFVATDFWSLIYAGFEGANYSQIPSTLDQVTVSESGMVQMSNRRVTFMIGSNDDMMPARLNNENLFGDDDISQLQQNLDDNQYLSDPSDVAMAFEPFLNYLAFMSPCEKLIFTYTNKLNDESTVNLSPYVARIAHYFGIKKLTHYPAIPDNNQPISAVYIGTKRGTLHHLIQVAQSAYRNQAQLNSMWAFVYQQLRSDPTIGRLTDHLLTSINYRNQPRKLNKQIVSDLYGDALNISISQLESFYNNPYEYFLKYGLRLQERDQFELSSASTGQFFHEALDKIISQIHDQHVDLTGLSDDDINQLVTENVSAIIHDPNNFQYVILTSSNRMNYVTLQLQATIQQMVRALRDQQKVTPMRPRNTELIFGQPTAKGLKGLSFDLKDGKSVNVRGRIDRIDSMKVGNKRYFGVVDYKSSDKKFDFNQAYAGTSMQLMTYLDVLKYNLPDLNPDDAEALLAGALYLHVVNAKFSTSDLQKDSFERALLKKHKYQGILVDDVDLVKRLDTELKSGYSSIFPFEKKKNGTLGARSSVISENELDAFLKHTENLIVKASERIFDGDIQLYPVKIKQKSSMQYTPYKSIMNFDPLLPENKYHQIPEYGKKKIAEMLREGK